MEALTPAAVALKILEECLILRKDPFRVMPNVQKQPDGRTIAPSRNLDGSVQTWTMAVIGRSFGVGCCYTPPRGERWSIATPAGSTAKRRRIRASADVERRTGAR
jgi:hypothetical protein